MKLSRELFRIVYFMEIYCGESEYNLSYDSDNFNQCILFFFIFSYYTSLYKQNNQFSGSIPNLS